MIIYILFNRIFIRYHIWFVCAHQVDLKWTEPDIDGLIKFMVEEKGFTEERIRNGAKKLSKARQGSTQGRLDGFFKVLSTTPKRKAEDTKGSAKKKGKGAGGFKRGK